MALPGSLNTITLIADYSTGGGFAGGAPVPGSMTLTPSTQLVDPTGHVIIPTVPIPMPLVGGTGSLVLLCTDNTDISPAGWYWIVSQSVGSARITWNILLPHTLGAEVYLDTLAPVTPGPAVSTLYGVLAAPTTNTWGSSQIFAGVVEINDGLVIDGTTIANPPGGTTEYLRADGTWQTPPGGGGTPSSTVADATGFAIAPDPGTASTYSRGDHQHGTPALPNASTSAPGIIQLNAAATNSQALGNQAAGSSGLAADATHVHPVPRLDQLGAPTAQVNFGNQRGVSVANGVASSDIAAFGQIPATPGALGALAAANNLSDVQNPATSRGNISAAKSGANSDITSLAALSTPLSVGQGGTGSATQTWVDLTTSQTVAGVKNFTSPPTGPTPVGASDLVNKAYTDAAIQGLSVKSSVAAATTTALPANAYSNGAAGIGATLTATGNGALTVDGYTASSGDRILVQNEAAPARNGIYQVTAPGSVSAPYILTRTADFDTPAEIPGAFVFVEQGSANASGGFVCTTPAPVVIGTTAIAFTQFSGAGEITAGTGLTKTGNVLALAAPVTVALGGTGTGSITGLVKGSGTAAFTAALAGTDYIAPAQAASTVQAATSFGIGAATGSDTTFAREDHQHGTPSLAAAAPGTTQAIGTAAALGSASTAAKADHVHPMAAAALPGNSAVTDTAATGVATTFAASDHIHGREGFGNVVALSAFGTAPATGSAATVSHSDHVHGAPALPVASTSAFGIVEFESAVANLQADGTPALGNNGHTVDSGHVHPLPPWVFSVLASGAKGDGRVSNTGATTASSTTITIGESVFTSGDVGKAIMVKNALNSNSTSGQTTAVGTITAVNSATSVTATWNTTPTQTSTGLQVLWATDDTAAIQSAIAAANTYAAAHMGYAEVYFPVSAGLYYGVAGPLKTTDGVNAAYNSQLTIPINGEQALGITLVFRGPEDAGVPRYWNADYPAWNGGIQSFGCFTGSGAQSSSITGGGNPSVIGGPTGKNGYGVLQGANTTPTYSNTCVVFENFTVRSTHSNSGWTYSAGNFFGIARFHAKNSTIGTNGLVQFYKYSPNLGDFTNVTLLSGGLSIGLLLPSNGNNASNYLANFVIDGGYTFGLFSMEHTEGDSVTVLYCWSGICPVGNYADSGSNAVSALHASAFNQACVEGCTYHVNIIGAGASGIGPIIHMVLDTEGTVQLRDAVGPTLANTGAGLAAAMGVIRLVGSPSTVTVQTGTGAGGLGTGLQIIKEQVLPGVASSSLPTLAANTSVSNTLWRNATVYLTGGANLTTIQTSRLSGGVNTVAVSTVADFTSAGTITVPFPVRLQPGGWIKINTSSGTTVPTAVWVLD